MVTLFLMAHYICRKNKKKNRFFGVCIGEKTLKAVMCGCYFDFTLSDILRLVCLIGAGRGHHFSLG